MSRPPTVPTAVRRTPLQVWRAFSFVLASLSLASMLIAAVLVPYSNTPDGRDAFYIGIAWQFAIWGLIDLFFAASGIVETSKLNRQSEIERNPIATDKAKRILNILKTSRWQNAVWISLGVITLLAGFWMQSPATAGHGVGVIVQAMVLVFFDRSFSRALTASLRDESAQ